MNTIIRQYDNTNLQYKNIHNKKLEMFSVCKQASQILLSSYEQTALISGISDIIVVQWNQITYKTTPFLICLGSLTIKAKQQPIKIYINDLLIQNLTFTVNKYGYLQPFYPQYQIISKFNLKQGKNIITVKVSRVVLSAEVYLFNLRDKIIISDFDGTMTKTDIMGLVNNYRDTPYMHDGYEIFMNELVKNGYKIVWLTMRSMAMYNFSKNYINKHIGCQGALIPQPQQFLPSIKKQLLKKTINIKTNMMKKIRQLFPKQINPFACGLGNRQNDAIAYLAIGIPKQNIYLVSEKSQIMTMKGNLLKSYFQLKGQIETHFPPVNIRNYGKELLFKSKQSLLATKSQDVQVTHNQSNMKQFFKKLSIQNSIQFNQINCNHFN